MLGKIFLSLVMLHVKVINKSGYPLPAYATTGAVGMDLLAVIEDALVLEPMSRALIPTGLYLEIPLGYEAQVRPRSGLSIRYGITVINAPGTIDSDYRGEIKVPLINLGRERYVIEPGTRIAQMVFSRYERIAWEEVSLLSETERGKGGFGHTGN